MSTFKSDIIDPILRKYAEAWDSKRIHLMNLPLFTAVAVMCVVAIFVTDDGYRDALRWLIPISAILIATAAIAEGQWGCLGVLLLMIPFSPFWSLQMDSGQLNAGYSLAAGVIYFTAAINTFGSFDDALECMPPTALAMVLVVAIAPAIPVVLIAAVIWIGLRVFIDFDWKSPGFNNFVVFGAVAAVVYVVRIAVEKRKQLVMPKWVLTYAMVIVVVWMVASVVADGFVTWRLMNAGGAASAVIIDAYDDEREFDDGRRVGVVTVARYEFEVGSRKFYGSTEGPQGDYDVGDKLDVEFVVDDPSQNRAEGDRDRLVHFFIVFVIAAFITGFAITYWREEMKKI